LNIVLVPVIGAAVFRRWPQLRELLGAGVAAAGLATLTIPSTYIGSINISSIDGGFSVSHLNRGDLLTICCAIAFACHLLVLGYYSQRERFEAVAVGQIACAALLSSISLSIEAPRIAWSGPVLTALLVTAVLGTAGAFGVQTWAQQFTTPTRTALIFALEPVVALTTAILVGGERLTAAAIVGGALILVGIVTVEIKPSRRLTCQ
jgi:drug/metabolite transporter (DMT)-like permease